MKRIGIGIASILLFTFASSPAMALWDKELRISGAFEYAYLFGGSAGQFETTAWRMEPNLNTLYNPGLGARIELGYTYETNWQILLGFGYLGFAGGTDTLRAPNGDVVRLEIADFNAFPVYVGAKFILSEEPRKGLAPYLRTDLGAVISESVNARVTFIPSSLTATPFIKNTSWWERSVSLTWDVGGGVQYGLKNFAFFTEVVYQGMGTPNSAVSETVQNVNISGDGTRWSPISARLGVAYYF